MTSSRIVRGTKGRIFIFICGILVVTGVIAFYNNTRLQLEDAQKNSDLCHQQQENLSTQLQVIFDYKERLEKSLKTEKAEHYQAKTDFENRINQQKLTAEKAANEAKLQYTSLQQHYNLVQTEFADFKEESAKIQKENLDEINQLQSKLNEVQEQFKKSENDYKNKMEHLKSQIAQLEADKNMEKSNGHENYKHLLLENSKLQNEIKQLKDGQSNVKVAYKLENNNKEFDKQVQVSKDDFQIKAIDETNLNNKASNELNQVAAPKIQKAENNSMGVLAMPFEHQRNIPSSSTKSSIKISSANNNILPLKEPGVSPETKKESSPKSKIDGAVLPQPMVKNTQKKLPEGVVPIPNKIFADASKQSLQKPQEDDKNDIPEEVNAVLPARYRNNIIAQEKEHIAKNEKEQKEQQKEKNDEKDNAAQEVYDFPDKNEENDALKIQGKAEDNKIDKHHIDELGFGDKEHVAHGNKNYDNGDTYKEIANDMLEEDDEDEYPNLRNKDPAVRN